MRTSCSSLSCVGKDEPTKSTPAPVPAPAGQKSESNVAKLVVRFQIGHLHGAKSFTTCLVKLFCK